MYVYIYIYIYIHMRILHLSLACLRSARVRAYDEFSLYISCSRGETKR